jgi:hypothetical protein
MIMMMMITMIVMMMMMMMMIIMMMCNKGVHCLVAEILRQVKKRNVRKYLRLNRCYVTAYIGRYSSAYEEFIHKCFIVKYINRQSPAGAISFFSSTPFPLSLSLEFLLRILLSSLTWYHIYVYKNTYICNIDVSKMAL